MTIKLNGTTLTNSGFGTVLTNFGEGYLTNAAALTNEHRAYLINLGVGTTLTNEEASTLTNIGATFVNTGGATLTNPPFPPPPPFFTGTGTVLTNENGATLINGANSTIDNQDSATLTNSANVLNNGTINNSASFEVTGHRNGARQGKLYPDGRRRDRDRRVLHARRLECRSRYFHRQ